MASIYGGKIKYEIFRSHGKSPVDWIIKVGNIIIITVTEMKKEDIRIAQNGLHGDVMYRIVSTIVDWIIIKEKNLFKQIKWVFDSQIELQELSK